VRELGGKGRRQTPLVEVVDGPFTIHAHPVRDNRCFSSRRSPPNLVFSPPSGAGKKRRPKPRTVSGRRFCLSAEVFSCPRSFAVCFPAYFLSRCGRPYPPPVVHIVRGPHVRAMCRWDNPWHNAWGNLSRTGYRLRDGLVEPMDRVAASQNMLGLETFIRKPSVPVFSGGG
jgi:hypothetical protein